jgi:hypothetical protein
MRRTILLLVPLLCSTFLRAQDNTFRLTVLGFEWTTTHQTVTFSWPGSASTSCNGTSNMNGYVSGTNISANGTSSSTCSTSFTPPSNQNIDIQKPVVFILADTETDRLVMTCTRNVRWSQCHGLNPGYFLARNDNGHFEVQARSDKGKEEWVKFDVVQRSVISRSQASVQASAPQTEAPVSIDAPASIESPRLETNANGFPARWKSMTSGTVRTLRFEGDYIYGETVLSDAAAKAGMFSLLDLKKDGDKYVGKVNGKFVRSDGAASCSVSSPTELTMVTPDRIEGRSFYPPANAKLDWSTCTFSPPADWQTFTWIPVR